MEIKNLLEAIVDENALDVKNAMSELMLDKIRDALEEKKAEVAQRFFEATGDGDEDDWDEYVGDDDEDGEVVDSDEDEDAFDGDEDDWDEYVGDDDEDGEVVDSDEDDNEDAKE